jgi:hypothetical protein
VFMKVLSQPPQTASSIDYEALDRLPTELT